MSILIFALVTTITPIVYCVFPLVRYPVTINVWICGFQEEDIRADAFESILYDILPSYIPEDYLPNEKFPKRSSTIEFILTYKVHTAHTNVIRSYEDLITSKPTNTALGLKELDINDISEFIWRAVSQGKEYFGTEDIKPNWFNIPIVILYKNNLPKHIIRGTQKSSCTQSVISSVSFIDLSASSCPLDNYLNHKAKHIRYNPPIVKHPWPFTFATDAFTSWGRMSNEALKSFLTGRLAGIITSAIQIFIPGIHNKLLTHTTDKIFIPIIILKNGVAAARSNSKESIVVDDVPIDISNIQKWVQSILLPYQKSIILAYTYHVEEHPQVAIALQTAQMSYTALHSQIQMNLNKSQHIIQTETIPYIDTEVLVNDLLHIGDYFIEHLLHTAGFGSDLYEIQNKKELNNIQNEKMNQNIKYHKNNIEKDEQNIILLMEQKNEQNKAAIKTMSSNENSNYFNIYNNKKSFLDLFHQSKSSPNLAQFDKRILENELLSYHMGVTVSPVIVLSDLHIHTKQSKAGSQKDTFNTDKKPIQPLLDENSEVAVKGNTVVVLHASDEIVSTYSQHGGKWMDTNLSDVNSRIAAGLGTALTGLKPPHLQQWNERDLIDLTWTHGDHPFPPFGELDGRNTSLQLSWASRRGTISSRIYTILAYANIIIEEAEEFMLRTLKTLLLFTGGNTDNNEKDYDINNNNNHNNNNIDKEFISEDKNDKIHHLTPTEYLSSSSSSSEEDTVGDSPSRTHPFGIFEMKSKLLKYLPADCSKYLFIIEEQAYELKSRVNELNHALLHKDEMGMTSLLISLEDNIFSLYNLIFEKIEKLEKQLKKCEVIFDKEGFDNMSSSIGKENIFPVNKRNSNSSMLLSNKRSSFTYMIILIILFLGICVSVISMKYLQDWVENRAKKVA